MNAPAAQELFTYASIEDAPVTHRQVAQLVCIGYGADDIARCTGLTRHQVNRIINYPVFMDHVTSLQARAALETAELTRRLQGVFSTSIDVLSKGVKRLDALLDNDEVSLSAVETAINQASKLLSTTADRMPGSSFRKVTKSETTLELPGATTAQENARTTIRDRFQALNVAAPPATGSEDGDTSL